MRSARLLPWLVLVASAPYAAETPQAPVPNALAVTNAYLEGHHASATLVEAWEAALAKNPDQPAVRERLIGHYTHLRFSDEAAKKRHGGHVLYVIGNYPESPFAGSSANIALYSGIDGATECAEARRLWLVALEAKPDDPRVLANAAAYLELEDKDTAERLLKHGNELEPKNSEWLTNLGRLYLRQTLGAKALDAKYAAASKALRELERALKLMPTEDERFQIMDGLVEASYKVDRLDKTATYAKRWMKGVPVARWDYANAQHYGHTALGLIALKKKDTAGAKEHLALSAAHKGSPQLNSFGPCMDLAAALLAAGERDAVLDYFEACGTFWTMGASKLADWTALVKAGRTLDFAGKLSF